MLLSITILKRRSRTRCSLTSGALPITNYLLMPLPSIAKDLRPLSLLLHAGNYTIHTLSELFKLQAAVNAYANCHIRRVQQEDTYAHSRGNKLLDAQPWMRSDGFTAADWAVITRYLEVLKPLKAIIKRLEARSQGEHFSTMTGSGRTAAAFALFVRSITSRHVSWNGSR